MKTKILSVAIALYSAFGYSVEDKKILTDVSPNDGAALLGYGYDSHKVSFKNSCVHSTEGEKILYAGKQESELFFKRSMSYEALRDYLEVEVKGKLNYGAFNARGAAKFVTNAASSELSESLIFASITRGKTALINNPRLNPAGLGTAQKGSKEKSIETCGDEFVRGVKLGSQLLINVRFDFANLDVKTAFEADIDLDYVSLFSVQGAAKVISERYGNHISISITAYQIGGAVQNLPTIFKTVGGKVAIMDCHLKTKEGIKACNDALTRIISYASDEYPKQIKDLKYDPTEPNGAAYMGYETMSYSEGGNDLDQLLKEPNDVLKREIKEARERLAIKYETYRSDRRVATKLLSLTSLTKEEKTRIRKIDGILKSNINKVVDLAGVCFDRPLNCVKSEKNTSYTPYDRSQISHNMIFIDYCQLPGISAGITHTVNEIKKIFGAKESCSKIWSELQNVEELDLSGLKIVDLFPIKNLKNIRILNLGKNNIKNIRSLATLTDLLELNIRENNIGPLDALGSLVRLESLDLAYNNIRFIDTLKKLKNLKVLKIHGESNQVRDWTPIKDLKLDVLYKDLNSICESERLWLHQNRPDLCDRQCYDQNKAMNFAPWFTVPGDHNSIFDTFVTCNLLDGYY